MDKSLKAYTITNSDDDIIVVQLKKNFNACSEKPFSD